MKRFFALALAAMITLTACGGGASAPPSGAATENATASAPAENVAKDQEYNDVYAGELTTINYLTTASTNEFAAAANFVDSLIDYDKYGVPQPALATEWSTSEDGLVWTFKLRPGVKWVDYTGKEVADVKAQDFVDSAQYILTSENESQTSDLVYSVIKNAEAYYNKEITDIAEIGVKAIDDLTLEYTLIQPTPYFLSMLTYVCFFPVNGQFLQEQGTSFGTDNTKLLYNGAYRMETFEPQSRRVYVKNDTYWDKEHVYIETVNLTYNKEASTLSPEMFARGEIGFASIPSSILDLWMKDPAKKELIRPSMNGYYTYWYAFNFNPTFDEQYQPDNWRAAVNNANFRQAIFHALDRKAAMLTDAPYDPESRLLNTVTPKNFVDYAGVDYTVMGPLKEITQRDSFDEAKAVEFKAKAMEELKDKVTFPVKVLMPYNPGVTSWTNRVQVVKQQVEKVLGTDFVEFIIEPGPTTGFLSAVRRSGKYAFLEVNWGPDYADPQTYTDPFTSDNNYAWNDLATEYLDADGIPKYDKMVAAAKKEVTDLQKRYQLFAEAEAFLINNAIIIPYGVGSDGYVGSLFNPFEAGYSPFGVASLRYKGEHILAKPMNTEEYEAAYAKWEAERAAALKAYTEQSGGK